MKLKRILIKNFQPFDDIEQEINLETNDITLVTGFNKQTGGSNGSGKSSWIDALIWCLYGKTRSLADDVCNKFTGKKNCKVQVDFEKDSNLYEIIRYRKHDEQGNKLYIFKNKEDKSYDSNKDTQDYLESLLKISQNAFISSLVFEKENYTPFLSSTQGERAKIIENILLDVNTVTLYYKKVSKIIKNIEEKEEEIGRKILETETNIKNIDTTLLQYKNSIKKKIEEARLKKSEIEEELKKYNNIKNIDELKNNLIKIEKFQTEKSNIEKSISLIRKNVLGTENIQKEIYKIEKEIKQREEKIKEIEENINICPTCKQKVNEEITKGEINKEKEKIKSLEKDELEKNKTLLDIEKNNKEYEEKINEEYKKLKNCEQLISETQVPEFSLIELNTISEKIGELENNLKQQQHIINHSIDKNFIEEKKKDKEKYTKDFEDLSKKLEALSEEKKYLDYFYTLFSNKSGGFKKYLISKILGMLNEKLNQFLSEYFDYEINVEIDNSLNDTWLVNGEPYSFKEFSSGEKMRIELSCVFALFFIVKAYLGVSSNILILDEILDLNLDSLGIKSTIDILNKLKNEGNSIFVISHKNTYIEQFNNRIKITKEKNKCSKIESDVQTYA